MIATRFWIALISLLLGAAALLVSLSVSMHDRLGLRMVSEGLSSDSLVASWYLKNSAREAASQLIRFSGSGKVARSLAQANSGDSPSSAVKSRLRGELTRIASKMPAEQQFDAMFAVNRRGQVVAHTGFSAASSTSNLELGGFPLVADALHGHIRDDTLLLDRLYRAVARPVELDLGQEPVGAIVGAYLIDDAFARRLSEKTGLAIAFYSEGRRIGTAAPEGFDRSGLDQIVSDLPSLEKDEDYKEKGRTGVHHMPDGLSAVYARLPGEAWRLGAGYAVVRQAAHLGSFTGIFSRADEKDKRAVSVPLVVGLVLLSLVGGLALTQWEHVRPLSLFRGELKEVADAKREQVRPERMKGPFRQIALDVNLALDRVGGASSDVSSVAFEQVFGDAEPPPMSAFGVPGSVPAPAGGPSPPTNGAVPAGLPGMAPAVLPGQQNGQLGGFPGMAPSVAEPTNGHVHAGQVPAPQAVQPPPPPRRAVAGESSPEDVEAGWHEVYHEFVQLKQQCGENTEGFTFERFCQTLRKNRDTLMEQHGVARVQFSAYVKQGRAALKARPVRT